MGLRDEQRALTQRKVLTAALELFDEGANEDFAMHDLAKRSGVSLATIYRHFPTKDALVAAVAVEPVRRALETADDADDADDYLSFISSLWTELSAHVDLLRRLKASSVRDEQRSAQLANTRDDLARYLISRDIEPASEAGKRLISLLALIGGSSSLLELHDRQGIDIDEAIDTAVWAMDTLIGASQEATR